MGQMRCPTCQRLVRIGSTGLEHSDDTSPICAQRDGNQFAVNTVGDDVPRCDFCNSDHPTVLFDGVSETYVTMLFVDDDGATDTMTDEFDPVWAACDECAQLVRARDPYQLAARAVNNLQQAQQCVVPVELVEAVKDVYETFFSVWAGAERPVPS